MDKHIIVDTSKAKRLPPVWASPFLAYGFVSIGSILGTLILGIVLGLFLIPFFIANPQASAGLTDLTGLDSQFANLLLCIELLTFAFTAGLVFLWVKFVEKRPLSSLGFYKEKWWKELLRGWGLGILLFASTLCLLLLTGLYSFERVDFSFGTLFFVLLIQPLWLLQGGTEELVTRGWLFPVLTAKSNRWVGIAVSSSLFGLLHLGNSGVNPLSIVNIILFGVLMVLYLLKTDNLWGIAGIHGAWNFAQGNLFGILVSGNPAGSSLSHFTLTSNQDWLTGGEFGVEGSIVTSLVLLVAIACLAYQLKKK